MRKLSIPEEISKLARSYLSTHPMKFCVPQNVKLVSDFFNSEAYEWYDEKSETKMAMASRMWNVHSACEYVGQYVREREGTGNRQALADLMVAQAFGTMVSMIPELEDNPEALGSVAYLVSEVVSEAFVIRES